jgi:uncharacterized protein (DUF1697 family)
MGTFVALLRSINVGGRNRVAMAELRQLATSLGFQDVATYLQSGNLVFSAPGSPASIGRALHEGLVAELAVDVPVIVRSRSQMGRLPRTNPFTAGRPDPTSMHVTFLGTVPDRQARADLEARAGQWGADQLVVEGTEVFLYCPGGYAATKLHNTYLERHLGTTATTRNWRTVLALVEAVDGVSG